MKTIAIAAAATLMLSTTWAAQSAGAWMPFATIENGELLLNVERIQSEGLDTYTAWAKAKVKKPVMYAGAPHFEEVGLYRVRCGALQMTTIQLHYLDLKGNVVHTFPSPVTAESEVVPDSTADVLLREICATAKFQAK